MTRPGFFLFAALGGLAVTIACASEAGSPGSEKAAAAPPVVSAATLEKGRGLYMATCAPCHGNLGKGDGPASKIFKPRPRDHTDAVYMSTLTDDDLAKTIQQGGAMRGKPLMPSNPQLRGDDLSALVAFVRSLSRVE